MLVFPCSSNRKCSRVPRRAGRPQKKRRPASGRRAGMSTLPLPHSFLRVTFHVPTMDPIRNADSSNGASKARISIDDFSKIEVKIGTVRRAERIPDTTKLLRLIVDFNEVEGPRQIVSGIAAYAPEPERLVGRQLAFVTKLV